MHLTYKSAVCLKGDGLGNYSNRCVTCVPLPTIARN